MKKLLQFINRESQRLIKKYPCNSMDRETYARAVKLIEEVGELFSEILKLSALQRKRQSTPNRFSGLADEFADVIIGTLLLAKRMNVNIGEALHDKIKKINKRYE